MKIDINKVINSIIIGIRSQFHKSVFTRMNKMQIKLKISIGEISLLIQFLFFRILQTILNYILIQLKMSVRDQKSSQKIAQKSDKFFNAPEQKSNKLRQTSFSDVFNYKKHKQQIQVGEQIKDVKKVSNPTLFKRSTKIYNLQEEFQLLKKKIKQVETKNEKIIEKIQINKNTDDKRSIQNTNYVNKTPNHYNINSKSQLDEEQLHKYQQYQLNQKYGMRHKTEQLTPDPNMNWQNQRYSSDSNQKWITENVAQQSIETSKYIYDLEKGVQQSRRENEKQILQIKMLEEKLKKQQNKSQIYKSNYRQLYENVKYIISAGMQKLMQNTIIDKLFQIDRKNKRNKQRLDQILQRTQSAHNQRKMFKKFLGSLSSHNLLPKNNNNQKFNKRQQEINFEKQKELQNKRFKELEVLVEKYEKIIKAKNDQLQTYIGKCKTKDKQINDIKIQLHRVKDQKKKIQNDFQFETEELSIKVNTITDNNKKLLAEIERLQLSLQKKNNKSISEVQLKQKICQNQSLRSKIQEMRNHIQKLKNSLGQSKQSLQNSQRMLNQKNKLIISLEKQLLNNKQKKSQLFSEYQQNLQKNRNNYKLKLQQLNNMIEQLNSKIAQKDEIIKDLQYKEKNFKQKEIQYQIELSTMQQKLNIKQEFEKQSLCSFRAYKRNSTTSTENDMEYKTFIESLNKEIKQLQLQNNQLKLNQDRIKIQREKERIDYKNLTEKLYQQITKTKLIIKEKQENKNDFEYKIEQLKQRQDEMNEQKQRYQTEQTLLQKQLQLIRDEKNSLEQKILHYQNVIVKDLKKQLTDKQDQIMSLQGKLQKKSKEIQSYIYEFNELEKEFQRYQSKFQSKQTELTKYQSADEQQKILITKLERQLKQSQQEIKDFEALKNQNHKYQLKLKDLQQQTKSKLNYQNKLNQEYKQQISKLKQQNQKLKVSLINFEQINKYQKNKIEELQIDLFNLNTNQLDVEKSESNLSYSKFDKIKNLEKNMLDGEILKVNLQRKISNLQEEITKMKQDYNNLFTEYQNKKSEFNKQILFYDEKNQDQEKTIQNLEKIIKQKYDHQKNCHSNIKEQNKVIKSQIKSQASLMFSINSFEDRDLEFHLQQDYDDINEANISEIFKLQNIATNEQLKKKKSYYQIFQKTSNYISNLKKSISEKNKRIKVLQRTIDALKQNRNIEVNKLQFNFEQQQNSSSFDLDDLHENYSMILEPPTKKNSNNRKIKQIQQQAMLIKQQNNLLTQQLEKLQDDLENAEQQQDNLVRMKQIYKQQINNLKKLLQQKQKTLEQSQSVHNLQAIRQLFIKIKNILALTDQKKQQKKKELEEYMKIIMNLLNMNKQKNGNKK